MTQRLPRPALCYLDQRLADVSQVVAIPGFYWIGKRAVHVSLGRRVGATQFRVAGWRGPDC